MHPGKLFRRGQPLGHEFLIDRENLALAADHPEVGDRGVNHFAQDHGIVPVPARDDDHIRVRRLGPVAHDLHDVAHQVVVGVREPGCAAQRRPIIHDGDFKAGAGGIVRQRPPDVSGPGDQAYRLRQERLEIDRGRRLAQHHATGIFPALHEQGRRGLLNGGLQRR